MEEEVKKCERCTYEVAEYQTQWGKVLCNQCNLDFEVRPLKKED